MKIVRTCWVPGCEDRTSKRHRFPSDERAQEIYIQRIGNPSLAHEKEIVKKFICERHFTPFCIDNNGRLVRYSLPTIDLPGFTEPPTKENSFLYLASQVKNTEQLQDVSNTHLKLSSSMGNSPLKMETSTKVYKKRMREDCFVEVNLLPGPSTLTTEHQLQTDINLQRDVGDEGKLRRLACKTDYVKQERNNFTPPSPDGNTLRSKTPDILKEALEAFERGSRVTISSPLVRFTVKPKRVYSKRLVSDCKSPSPTTSTTSIRLDTGDGVYQSDNVTPLRGIVTSPSAENRNTQEDDKSLVLEEVLQMDTPKYSSDSSGPITDNSPRSTSSSKDENLSSNVIFCNYIYAALADLPRSKQNFAKLKMIQILNEASND